MKDKFKIKRRRWWLSEWSMMHPEGVETYHSTWREAINLMLKRIENYESN